MHVLKIESISGVWRKGKCERKEWWRAGGEIKRWPVVIEIELQWESKVREIGWGGWVKWEGEGRVYNFIYIYIYGFLVILVLIGLGSGLGSSSGRVSLKPGPVSSFILKIQTQPYCFMGRVKPVPLGSSWARYPQVGYFLPYLTGNPIDDGYRLKTVTWSVP